MQSHMDDAAMTSLVNLNLIGLLTTLLADHISQGISSLASSSRCFLDNGGQSEKNKFTIKRLAFTLSLYLLGYYIPDINIYNCSKQNFNVYAMQSIWKQDPKLKLKMPIVAENLSIFIAEKPITLQNYT